MAASDLSELSDAYERSRRYVETLADRVRRHDVSDFWAGHFADRPRSPSFNDVLVLRRGGFTYGVGQVTADFDEEAERAWADATYRVASLSAPDLDLEEWPETEIGAPLAFDVGGVMRSGSAVINALTSHRIREWCRRRGLDRPLRVLEIGPGYGQGAVQLIGELSIERYCICDLPENLLLSSYYLQTAQSTLPVTFVGADDVLDGVVFAIPSDIERLPGPFDLVVNAYSLQEMNLESVVAYYRFIAENLAPDGIFYSLNAHGKAGVRTPADYPVELFGFEHFGPLRRFPFFLFATEPYELVLAHDRPLVAKEQFDDLAVILQLGFVDELAPLCERLTRSELSADERTWLSAAREAYAGNASVADRQLRLAAAPDVAPGATALIAGALALADGDDPLAAGFLKRALESLGPNGARVRALTFLAASDRRTGARDEAVALAPHLAAEVDRYLADRTALRARVRQQLGLSPTRLARVRSTVGRVRAS